MNLAYFPHWFLVRRFETVKAKLANSDVLGAKLILAITELQLHNLDPDIWTDMGMHLISKVRARIGELKNDCDIERVTGLQQEVIRSVETHKLFMERISMVEVKILQWDIKDQTLAFKLDYVTCLLYMESYPLITDILAYLEKIVDKHIVATLTMKKRLQDGKNLGALEVLPKDICDVICKKIS